MNAPIASSHLPVNRRVATVTACLLLAGCVYLATTVSGRQAALFVVGALIGLAAYHSDFSFPATWRLLITERDGTGVRAHALMLAVGVTLFVPALSLGSLFGVTLNPTIAPVSASLWVGALISGIGMQLSSRCACGTLYTSSGGSSAMITTLIAFICGSVLATAHMAYWNAWPAWQPISLHASFGALPALILTWCAIGCIVIATRVIERRPGESTSTQSWLRGPWPLLAGALTLAALNFATLVLSGHAWRVTSAFALWGAKALMASGFDVTHWAYWTTPDNAAALAAPLSHDVPSIMNIGIIIGALLAAALAGRYGPVWRIPWRPWLAATCGGFLLGYGARLAFGSNVGAYFSGVVSTSVHGWVWGIAAFAGSIIGIRLRPLFGLPLRGGTPVHDCT